MIRLSFENFIFGILFETHLTLSYSLLELKVSGMKIFDVYSHINLYAPGESHAEFMCAPVRCDEFHSRIYKLNSTYLFSTDDNPTLLNDFKLLNVMLYCVIV